MESIASRIKQTKIGINIKLKLKLAFKVIQNIGGKSVKVNCLVRPIKKVPDFSIF